MALGGLENTGWAAHDQTTYLDSDSSEEAFSASFIASRHLSKHTTRRPPQQAQKMTFHSTLYPETHSPT
jgi:hypothetical protein